jgi:hypothetical protein
VATGKAKRLSEYIIGLAISRFCQRKTRLEVDPLNNPGWTRFVRTRCLGLLPNDPILVLTTLYCLIDHSSSSTRPGSSCSRYGLAMACLYLSKRRFSGPVGFQNARPAILRIRKKRTLAAIPRNTCRRPKKSKCEGFGIWENWSHRP